MPCTNCGAPSHIKDECTISARAIERWMKDGTGPQFFRQWKESQGIKLPPPPSEKKESHLAQPAHVSTATQRPAKDHLSAMFPSLTSHQVKEFAEVFSIYDSGRAGKLSISLLQICIRSAGDFPSQEDIAKIVEDLGKDTFDVKDFFAVMVKRLENPDTQIETVESFRVFDKNADGTVISEEMKFILGSYGEPLSKTEIQNFLAEGKIDQYGGLNYQELVKLLWSKREVGWV